MQNTVSNSPNLPEDTANNGNNLTRTRAKRRIDAATISEIARLCARQLTESEACRKIGVRPQAWFSWKSRHNRSEKFAALLEAFRAERIDTLITNVEDGANGKGMKQPDWRAAAHLLKIADAARFGDGVKSDTLPQVQIVSDSKLTAILDKVFGAKPVVAVETATEPKQIN